MTFLLVVFLMAVVGYCTFKVGYESGKIDGFNEGITANDEDPDHY